MNWAHMIGDAKARHCSQCSKMVHNLSAMPRWEADALLASGGGRLCIAFALTPEGRLVSQPEISFLKRGLTWLRGSLAFASGLMLAGCASTPPLASSEPTPDCQTPVVKETKDMSKLTMGDEGNFFVECPQVPPEKQGTKGR